MKNHLIFGTLFIVIFSAFICTVEGEEAKFVDQPVVFKGKYPGPEGPALIIPRGDLVCRHLTIYGVLEWWSNGRKLFFHRFQKTDPWKKSESLKLFF